MQAQMKDLNTSTEFCFFSKGHFLHKVSLILIVIQERNKRIPDRTWEIEEVSPCHGHPLLGQSEHAYFFELEILLPVYICQ